MRMLEQVPRDDDPEAGPATERYWADQTRRTLTRDLLRRAARAGDGERQALRFRALHLNLPLVGEVAERLELTPVQRDAGEHHALEGLLAAIQAFDPDAEVDFSDFAAPFVEQQLSTHLPRPTLRLTQPLRSAPDVPDVGVPVRGSGSRVEAGARPRSGVRLAVRRVALVIAGSHP